MQIAIAGSKTAYRARFSPLGMPLAYLGQENAGKRKFDGLTKMEITMTNKERIKSWLEHCEQVRDLAAANGDYLRWEAAEREIENYETVLKRWSVKE